MGANRLYLAATTTTRSLSNSTKPKRIHSLPAVRSSNGSSNSEWSGYDPLVDAAAEKHSVRLTPSSILYAGKSIDGISHLIRSAQYLHRELPVRIAHRVVAFRQLPYIVGANPHLQDVHDMYLRAFHTLSGFPKITTWEEEQRYSRVLKELLDDHRDVVSMLAQSFQESQPYMEAEARTRFLDSMLTSRLGIRMLIEHHLALHQERPNYIGLICINLSVRRLLEKWAGFSEELCMHHYGVSPEVKISGHVDASFPYITTPLDYILPEIFKNALRATVETHSASGAESPATRLPSVHVTIANNEVDFQIRISDRAGGIPHRQLPHVMDYHFTTTETARSRHLGMAQAKEDASDPDPMGDLTLMVNQADRGPISGFGFGLPTSRAYADYLGGSLSLESMYGIGTDAYLRMRHFDSSSRDSVRI